MNCKICKKELTNENKSIQEDICIDCNKKILKNVMESFINKCEVCEEELTPENESERKGVCKKCQSEILARIRKNANYYEETTSKRSKVQDDGIVYKKTYRENRVAKAISTMNNIIFGIILTVAIIIIIYNTISFISLCANENDTYKILGIANFIPIIVSIVQIILAFIGYILLKGYAEIIFLLDKINQKIK